MGFFQGVFHFFSDLFPLVRLGDLVDILLVAFLFYRFLVIIKGTRTAQILATLAILFFLYWISDRLEIRTLRAVLAHVFDNIVILFVILFQNDIRRAFSQMGKTAFLRGSIEGVGSDGGQVEEIVKSCVSLANKKIGALIVLEGQADVMDFIEPGTVLDANLTKELISSIFLPVSPLHDGAVIVRKGKLFMAGCFLPLTLSPMSSKSVGTRHRAAVGLTEETDALCIVVSEETGSISLASNGKIAHNLDASQLRKGLLGTAA